MSPSILQFVAARAVTATFDPRCVDGLEHTRYAIPSGKVDFQLIQVPVPTSALRTTGYGPNIFAIESSSTSWPITTAATRTPIARTCSAATPAP